MNFSAPFIKRPVGTSLLAFGLLLAGGLAFFFLPIAPLPQVEYPVINIQAILPGASPETMASAVATPLERQFSRIAGINQMTSVSQLSATNVTLQFELDRDIDAAGRDVQAAINAARGQLPPNLPNNPSYRKSNPADQPIMVLAMNSDTIDRSRVYDVVDSIIAQRILQIKGVGQIAIRGSARPSVRVEMNPAVLNKLGIGFEQVRSALNSANANVPKGQFSDSSTSWTITNNDQIFTAADYGNLVLANRNGSIVRLKDVAEVDDSVEDIRNVGMTDGRPGVTMQISRQPGENIIATVERILALLPELQASIPAGIKIHVFQDRTVTIRASVHDIERSLLISIVLVVLVVFVFLRSPRATFIPSVAVPLSLIATFGVMYLLDYSLDNLSLMALAISTGFVVDDAIVVLENITRYIEEGMQPMQAALRGAREIGSTVFSMSSSLIAVFIPLLLMGGIVGRLFREFAITMSAAIAISLLVSLTVTPMLCSRILRPLNAEKHGWMYLFGERVFHRVLGAYSVGLRFVLRHQAAMLALTASTAVLSVYLYTIIPKGFFPQQDTGIINGTVVGRQDISFASLREKTLRFYQVAMNDPAYAAASGGIGGAQHATNDASMTITLKDAGERDVTADQFINRLRPKLAAVPGARLLMRAAQDLTIGGRASASQYQYTLQGENIEELNNWATRVQAALARLPEIRDVSTDQQSHGLEAKVVIDRDTASRLGVKAQAIDEVLYDSFGQRQVSTMYRSLNQYHVILEVAPRFQQDPDALNNIYVRSNTGKAVPLSAFSHFQRSNTSIAVNHQGLFPAITLSFNLAPGVSLGQATAAVEKAARTLNLPATIHASFQGAAAVFQTSLASDPWLILAALITVYIVLGVLYESYIHPITILSALPSAGVGALLALLMAKLELNVIGLIGIILLIGLVIKNAIMMIDFALEAERGAGMAPAEAIYQACVLRFRPIMMTTMAALLGGLPLALGTGIGSELRRPLGISIVGGLIVSQILTLFTTPVVYLWFDRLARGLARVRTALVFNGTRA